VALYLGKLWRWGLPHLVRGEQFSRLAYRAELDRLAELGLVRRRGESREAFADRVRGVLPSFGPLTALHVGARFGSELAKKKPPAELKAMVRGMQRERQQAFGPFRRLRALLSPTGWLRTR
jgi:hypothetical protein